MSREDIARALLAQQPAVNPLAAAMAQKPTQTIRQPPMDIQGLAREFADQLSAPPTPVNTSLSDPEILKQLADQRSPIGSKAMGLVNAVLGVAPFGITAYHGSPYKFDKFDMSKIGTGEGAQAYGHGLYFAEQPGVARTYQQMAQSQVEIGGKAVVPTTEAERQAVNYLQNALDSGSANPFAHARQSFRAAEGLMPGSAKFKAFNDVLDRWQQAGAQVKAGGNLYKVDIPDEAVGRMLDWDKKLSEQPEIAQKVIKRLLKHYQASGSVVGADMSTRYVNFMQDITGAEAMGLLENYMRGNRNVSTFLKKEGIPGIKYLDQGSRNPALVPYWNLIRESDGVTVQQITKKPGNVPQGFRLEGPVDPGTRNFVLFDENLAKILERK